MATNNKETMNGEHMHEHCWCGMHHGYGGYFGLRWVLAIIILLMMFWLGMKVGEFKGFVEANYGSFGGYHNMMYRTDGPEMMKFWQAGVPAPTNSSSTTTTPSTSTKK